MNYETIEVRKLTPRIGAEIFGADLTSTLSNRQVAEIRQAFLENQVIFFRDQRMTIEQHKAFGRHFGKLHQTPNPRHAIDPEIIGVSADADSKYVSGDSWHSDTTCAKVPPLGSILHIIETPENGGGDTLFASMYEAYDSLSEPIKAFIANLTAVHDGERVYRSKGRVYEPGITYPRNAHPVVMPHPETGRKALFVNPMFTSHIVELSAQESRGVLEMLYEHAAAPQFQCRFKWQPHSVAFWDNRCTHHHAIWDYYPHKRFGHRVTVAG